MEDWKECTLGDVTQLVIDYRGKTPKKLNSDWSTSGYRALSAKNIKTGHIVQEDTIRFVDEKLYKLWMKDEIQRGDILITSEAPFGQILYWNSDEKIVLSQRVFGLRLNNNIDSRYIYFFMTTNEFQKELDARSTGTTVVGLRQPELMKCKVRIPPLPTQQKIAQILSSLDDKIELNNKINANLEQQAQALFKSWFVDFEPFGGEMPAGWKVGKLSEIANYSGDKISISELNNDTYYSTENMLPNKAGVEAASTIPNVIQTTRCFPGETIISNIRPYFKKIYYCTEKKAGCSTDVLCFKPITENFSEYLYQILYSDKFFDYMVLGSKGTKMPRGDKQQIMNYGIVIPDNEYLLKFKNFAKPILEQTDYNGKENKRLANLRDTLLPKLMNGEIEV